MGRAAMRHATCSTAPCGRSVIVCELGLIPHCVNPGMFFHKNPKTNVFSCSSTSGERTPNLLSVKNATRKCIFPFVFLFLSLRAKLGVS